MKFIYKPNDFDLIHFNVPELNTILSNPITIRLEHTSDCLGLWLSINQLVKRRVKLFTLLLNYYDLFFTICRIYNTPSFLEISHNLLLPAHKGKHIHVRLLYLFSQSNHLGVFAFCSSFNLHHTLFFSQSVNGVGYSVFAI